MTEPFDLPVALFLKGIQAVPPRLLTVLRLSRDEYALSATISLISKCSAIFSISGLNFGESPLLIDDIIISVMMLVLMPAAI